MNQSIKHKKYYRWTIYLFIAFLSSTILAIEDVINVDDSLLDVAIEFLFFNPFLFLMLFSLGKIASYVLDQVFNQITWLKSIGQKRLLLSLIVLIQSIFFMLIFMWVGQYIPDTDGNSSFFDHAWMVWVSCLLNIIIAYCVEAFLGIIDKQHGLELQNERLLRNQDLARYQALVHQISPHFLFNSLNVLSYLVHKNPFVAERFIEELSKIYRYILELSDAYVVPLSKELDFIQSYIYLQKLRYEENLHFESTIDAEALNLMLPPLTLELLVENAIKHNVIAPDSPLYINLSIEGKELVVRNNLQPRMEKNKASLSIGIKNLKAKYQMLESRAPQFFTHNGAYIAKIPLLEPSL